MEHNFDILIPGQHTAVAKIVLGYVKSVMRIPDGIVNKVAKEIVSNKYWEAYDCKDDSRQEYWRLVLICLDTL